MTPLKAIVFACLLSGAACSAQDQLSARDSAIAEYQLTSEQVQIMDAYVEGLKNEGKGPLLGYKSFEDGAACYASNIRVPNGLFAVHLRYVSDYMKVEEDFYPWFAKNGVNRIKADDLYDRAGTATTYCKGLV